MDAIRITDFERGKTPVALRCGFDYEGVDRSLAGEGSGAAVDEERAREIAMMMWREIYAWVSAPLLHAEGVANERALRAVSSRLLASMRIFRPEDSLVDHSYLKTATLLGISKQAHHQMIQDAKVYFGVGADGSVRLKNR